MNRRPKLAAPFLITPASDFLAEHPYLTRHARRLSTSFSAMALEERPITQRLVAIGSALWHALDIDEAFDSALDQADGGILPLVICSDDAQILNLSWECLYHPTQGFLALHRAFTITRQLDQCTADAPIPKGPLKVLLFSALPDDGDPVWGRLNIERERTAFLTALHPAIDQGRVVLDIPEDGRFSTLRHLTENGGYHLVVLSCHGQHSVHLDGKEESQTRLFFENELGARQEVTGKYIAEVLAGNGIQCVVLSACQSASLAGGDLNTGMATLLAKAAIPHVIGMGQSISDDAAATFSRVFCHQLIGGTRPDLAVQIARSALMISNPFDRIGDEACINQGDWTLPQYYAGSSSRQLVDYDFTSSNEATCAAPKPVSEPFIGRRRALRCLLEAMADPQHKCLVITGFAGCGKTRLAQRALEQFLLNRIRIVRVSLTRNGLQKQLEAVDFEDGSQEEIQKVVLFLDGLDMLADPIGAFERELKVWLRTFLAREEAPFLLITSRLGLPWTLPGVATFPLGMTYFGDFFRYSQDLALGSGEHHLQEMNAAYNALDGNFRALQRKRPGNCIYTEQE